MLLLAKHQPKPPRCMATALRDGFCTLHGATAPSPWPQRHQQHPYHSTQRPRVPRATAPCLGGCMEADPSQEDLLCWELKRPGCPSPGSTEGQQHQEHRLTTKPDLVPWSLSPGQEHSPSSMGLNLSSPGARKRCLSEPHGDREPGKK
ncbi:hypothetical protein Anapl_18037 [Anas platyrhynchos]|uniref:Uncharacterized protein n=1 Tax=Anas platyrhynchos TaxID=8839 RepID=R0KWI2_ANAPL|nr:hypothetical protein Anapl_18037 [Anas platyrhynchos]